MLTNFALVSVAAAGRLARAVDYDCPNESWEPVIDSTTGVQMIKVKYRIFIVQAFSRKS